MRRRIALAVAVLALLAGAGAALGASGSHTTKLAHAHRAARPSLLSVAAGYLGVSPVQLHAQLQSGKSLAQVAEASPGHSASGLTAALLASRSAHLNERITTLVNRAGNSRHARSSTRVAAASYLGLSRSRLRSKLHAGSSLAELAKATPGRSVAGLIDAIVAVDAGHEGLEGHAAKLNHVGRLAHIRERVSVAVTRKRRSTKTAH